MAEIVKPTPEQIAEILAKHAKYLRGEYDGERADLRGADLRGADLRGADLRGADLRSADLRGAYLNNAYLNNAYLNNAYLNNADLNNADLRGADLRGADLRSADLRGAYLPTGETFKKYLSQVLPALLIAGGKTIDEIIEAKAWDCHTWTNCPMHTAFGIPCASDGPPLLIPRIEQFVQLFDARLIGTPFKDELGRWIFPPADVEANEPAEIAAK